MYTKLWFENLKGQDLLRRQMKVYRQNYIIYYNIYIYVYILY